MANHVQVHSVVVKVHRTQDTIRDVEDRVAEALHMADKSKLVILLRHEPFISAKKAPTATVARSEVYNLMWRKGKTVEEGPRLDSFSS